jgi:hypothetical protein
MGLFGNKDEISVKLLAGQIKAVCARSFLGGELEKEDQGGDTCTYASRYLLPPQLSCAVGYGGCAICSVTRYGSFTVDLVIGKLSSPEKQEAFPQIEAALSAKGYDVYCKRQRDEYSCAMITVTKDGSTKATWKEDLTKMLNDIAMNAVRVLERY